MPASPTSDQVTTGGASPADFSEHVLVVDDEEPLRDLHSEMIRMFGYPVLLAESGAEALRALHAHKVFLVLSDLRMPEMSGLELCREIRTFRPELPFVLISGFADRGDAIEGMRLGANDLLDKPIQMSALGAIVGKFALTRRAELDQITKEIEEVL